MKKSTQPHIKNKNNHLSKLSDVDGGSMAIRPIRFQDLDFLLSCFVPPHPYVQPWTQAQLAEHIESSLQDEGYSGWVATAADDKNSPKAFVLLTELPDADEILLLATHPSARRQGAMTGLLQLLIEKSRRQGREMWLEVHEKNEEAQKLYLKMGFERVGSRRNYYRDGGTALLYCLPPTSTV